MKPILFAKDETDFTTNGLGRLDCISCHVIEERNGMYELEAEIPITGAHADQIEMLSIIGVIPSEGSSIQAFFVYKITKPINGRFMIYARHISYRLTDIPCMPFTISASPTACADTLAGLKSNAIESCPFSFSTDVTTASSYNQKEPSSIRQRLGGIEGSVLDQFGGEYEWDNFNVKLWKQRGRLANITGITLSYGKNITDINQEEEIANTITGVLPYWINTDGSDLVYLPEYIVYSQYASSYPYHLSQVLNLSSEYQDKPTVEQLRSAANAYINKEDIGVPKVSIEVSFVDLWKTEEYKDIAPLEQVKLCDEVYVRFEKLGINAIAKVVKTDYDVLKERYISIEVGSLRTTLAQVVTDRDRDIDAEFVEQITRVNTAIADATAWLTSANGYVVAVKNSDGSWKELLFMDANDPTQAVNVLRINNNGIGFSTSGINGPYTNAWTIDGKLNASFIKTGTLTADLIKAGVIADNAGKFSLNMATGALTMNSGTFKGTVSGGTISGGTISGATISGNTISGGTISGSSISGGSISGANITSQVGGNYVNINGAQLTVYGSNFIRMFSGYPSSGGYEYELGFNSARSHARNEYAYGYQECDSIKIIVAANNASDMRLKDDIQELSFEEAWAYITASKTYSFHFKEFMKDRKRFGMIAQEFKEGLDNYGEDTDKLWVLNKNQCDGMYCIEYQELVPHLIKVVTTQQEEINQLKQEIKDIKNILLNHNMM